MREKGSAGVTNPDAGLRVLCTTDERTRSAFFDHPILNSPYEYPVRHWALDAYRQPTQKVVEARREADFVTPIPKSKKQKGAAAQQQGLAFDEHSSAQ